MSELPRLLLCSFEVIPAPSGSSRRITEYLRGLSEHFNVVVLSTKTPDQSHIQKFEGARLLRVPVGSGDLVSRMQAFDRAVRRQLESEEYVVAHFTDPFGGYALCELRESYGYKLVYEAQGFPSQELRFTHPQLEGDRKLLARIRRQELYCLMNADWVITGSEVTRDFIHSLGVSSDMVEVIRAPVDLAPFTREAMGPPDGTPMRAVYLGSQVGWQGLPTLLRATRIALREIDMRLVLVGPAHTAWQPLLQGLAEELKLGDKVEFQPPVAHEDLHKLLATTDVGVVPLDDVDRNRVQGGALAKVAEYLAAGRPVIASDLPVARELLPEDVALFHEPGDPEDLAECLVALGKSPRRRVKMGQAAFALARTQHDAARIRERLRELYARLTGLAPTARRAEEGDAGGPAPTMIGTPLSNLLEPSERPGTTRARSGTDPVIVPQLRSRSGTDPAVRPLAHDDPRAAKAAAAEKRRERRRKRQEETDPAASTDPAQRWEAPRVVMGTLLRDEPMAAERHALTEPGAPADAEIPVVMGSPIRDEPPVPATSTPSGPRPSPATPRPESASAAPSGPPVLHPERKSAAPHALTPPLTPPRELSPSDAPLRPTIRLDIPPGGFDTMMMKTATAPVSVDPDQVRPPAPKPDPPSSSTRPELPISALPPTARPPPILTPPPVPSVHPAPLARAPDIDEPAEVDPDEVQPVDEDVIESEAHVDSADDAVVESLDEPMADEPLQPAAVSRVDAWFAQLVHGYCPPEGAQFQRPTPPTNFPGREGPPPPTVQPASPGPQSFTTRSGGG